MYNVNVGAHAKRDLRRLDRQTKNRVLTALLALADDPRPPGCLKIKGETGLWRIRVGDYRIGYEVDDATREVTVIKIGHRSEFYE